MKPFPLLSSLLLLTLPGPAPAHHGQEFFLLNDAKVQAPGSGLIQNTFSFSDEGYADSLRLTPGIVIGVLPRTAISVIADFAQEEGENWRYCSIEPSVLFDLTPKNFKLPIRFGVSFGYQFAEGGEETSVHTHGVTGLSAESLSHVHPESETSGTGSNSASQPTASQPDSTTVPHDHSTHDHGTGAVNPPAGGESNPDALTPEEIAAMGGGGTTTTTPETTAPAPAAVASPAATSKNTAKTKSSGKSKSKNSSSASTATAAHDHADTAAGHSHSHENSIHNHDDSLWTSRFTFEADLTKSTLLVGNLICSLPEGGSAAWGYGIGLRQKLRPGLAVGFEAIGDFDRHGYQEALGAVYWEPMHHLTLKAGVGTGLSSTSPDATVRAGLIWMF
ncbi:MAG: hypothetical protein V4726_00690 [Verrucomicrobiota bacterium]